MTGLPYLDLLGYKNSGSSKRPGRALVYVHAADRVLHGRGVPTHWPPGGETASFEVPAVLLAKRCGSSSKLFLKWILKK